MPVAATIRCRRSATVSTFSVASPISDVSLRVCLAFYRQWCFHYAELMLFLRWMVGSKNKHDSSCHPGTERAGVRHA